MVRHRATWINECCHSSIGPQFRVWALSALRKKCGNQLIDNAQSLSMGLYLAFKRHSKE
jgi:hypothetical protein